MEYNRHDNIPVESMDSSEVLDLVQNVFAQMYNGGFLQLCDNGLTDKLVDFKNRGFSLNEVKMHLSRYNFSKEKDIFNGLEVIYDILDEYDAGPIDHLCGYCDGLGFKNDTEACAYCGGSGTIFPSRWRDVKFYNNEYLFKIIDKYFYEVVPYEAYKELMDCDVDVD